MSFNSRAELSDKRISFNDLLPAFGDSSIFGTSAPADRAQINGVRMDKLSGQTLHIAGDAWIQGIIQTSLRLAKGISFGFGSATQPSITFEGDEDTGLYRAADGTIGIASNGVSVATIGSTALSTAVPITTPAGLDLVLNPSGGNIDMSGKSLVNVGGISVNANRYEVIGTTVTTTGTTPAVILNIPTVVDSVYNVVLDVTIAQNPNAAIIRKIFMVKNAGGVITCTDAVSDSVFDAALLGCTVTLGSSGINATVIGTPVGGTTKWYAAARITRQLF